MAILTKPTIAKGQPNEIDLSKSELALLSKVVNDSYFSDQANWSKVIIEYKSAEGSQHEMMIFDATGDSPKGNFEVSEKARDSWEVQSVKIMDFDGGYLKLGRGDLTVEEFDIALGSVGGDVGAIYTAFNYVNVLRPDELGTYDYFGRSVAVSGDYIVVGANNSQGGSGAAYVFKINGNDTISLLDALRPDGLNAGDNFGQSVAISGDYIVVGANQDDGADDIKGDSGAAYVFKINGNDTISLLDALRPDGLGSNDNFGRSVAISSDYIVVGTDRDDGAGNIKRDSGAAYVFKINVDDTISLLETLRPDGLESKDYFGQSVVISGDYIVVGAYGDDGAGNSKSGSGAAYVFKGVE
jgi:hypothetical protein